MRLSLIVLPGSGAATAIGFDRLVVLVAWGQGAREKAAISNFTGALMDWRNG